MAYLIMEGGKDWTVAEERDSERVLTLGDVFDDARSSRSFHSRHGSSVYAFEMQ